MAALVSGRDIEEDSEGLMASSRLVRSFDARWGKARHSRTSRRGKKGGKAKKVRKGANRKKENRKRQKGANRKNEGNSERKAKRKEKKASNIDRIDSLKFEEIRDYRWATNQRKIAKRVKGWLKTLGNKANNSRTFFLEAAEFFKDCPAALSVYQHMR